MQKKIFLYIAIVIGVFTACDDDKNEHLEASFGSNKQTLVVGEKVFFKDESLGNPVKWDWTFEGGTPETSNLFSPEIVYKAPGTYSVKLVVGRGDASSVLEKVDFITIDYPSEMKASFTIDKALGTEEEKFTFTDTSTGFPTSWAWEFISETETIKSTEQNPVMSFPEGVYTIKLTATSPKSTNTVELKDGLTVISKYAVAANMTVSNRNTYAGGSVEFSDASIGIVTSWLWTFEGGTPATSTEQNPKVTYATAGNFKVTLEAKNTEKISTIVKEKYISAIPSQDLIFYLPFNGDYKDVGPHALHPETIGKGDAPLLFNPTLEKGEGTMAVEFTSENANNFSILSMPETDLLDFKTSDFTVSFWVKISDTKSSRAVYHHGSGPNARPDLARKQSWFRFHTSGQYIRFIIEQTGPAGNWTDYTKKSMYDGEWHHYVGVHRGGSTYLYIDGIEEATALDKPIKEIDSSPYFIGCNYQVKNGAMVYENFMKGSIDNYILYRRALSPAEAKDLFDKY